jgi:dipeptidyl aminopeptidase/acylaminoacyl peptidase
VTTSSLKRGKYTFEQFAAMRRYMPVLSFSPDGSEIVYVTNTSGQYNLWRQSSAGGYPHQITTFVDQSVREAAWSPDGQTILFTADRQGNEMHQIYRIPARGGRPEQLTDAPGAQHFLNVNPWSPDGLRVAYATNDLVPTDQDVLVRDMATGDVERVMSGGGVYFQAGWSPDGTRLAVMEAHTNMSQDLHLHDFHTATDTHLTPRDAGVQYSPQAWAADGTGFYLLSDEGREFLGLAFFDLAAGVLRWLETPGWDIQQIAASDNGRLLAWVVNEDGYSRLHARDLTTGRSITLPPLPDGVIETLQVAPDGSRIGLTLEQPRHPAEVYVIDVTTGTATQLTFGFLGGIDEADLIEPELVHYPTHDRRDIPAFLYRPSGEGSFPVVLSIHGGPEAQELPRYPYSGLYQYWLDRGIGVLAPNVRGSTGYGKTYQKLIYRDWGGAELGDFEAAVRYLHTLDWVDRGRIGVFGGSFGGFATLSCVSRLPDYWAAAVDIVGPSNLVTLCRSVPPTWRRPVIELIGDPDTEEAFLLERSPITWADQIRTPLFIIQGANDPRVVQAESDQIVERLRARGVDVRYDVYLDEGHGFTKRENELKGLRDAAEFMEQHLLRG